MFDFPKNNFQLGRGLTSVFDLLRARAYNGIDWGGELFCVNSVVTSLRKSQELDKHTGCVNSPAWNESGTKLVSGSDDRSIVVWNGEPLSACMTAPTGHRNNVFCATFVPNSGDSLFVTSAADGCVHLLNIDTGQRCVLYDSEGTGFCFKHCMDPGNPTQTGLVTMSDGTVVRFDLRARTSVVLNVRQDLSLRQLSMGRYSAPPSATAIEFNPISPEVVALGTSTKALLLFDIRNASSCIAKVVPEFTANLSETFPGETEAVSGIAWDRRNRLIVNYCRQSVVEMDFGIISCRGYEPVVHRVGVSDEIPRQWIGRVNHQTFLKEVCLFGLNGSHVATGGDCGNIFIYERFGNQNLVLKQPADPFVLNCVAPHPYLPLIASSGIAHVASVWSPTFQV